MLKQKIQLDNKGITDIGKWNRYTLDLAKLIETQPGAIYQISISFKKAYASYMCDGIELNDGITDLDDEIATDFSYDEDYYEDEYYYDEDYDWTQRDNPCNSSYYTNSRSIRKNVLASDLGLMAKRGGDGSTLVIVNDLKTTEPLNGVTVDFYNYQQQLIASMTTNPEGKAEIKSAEAEKNNVEHFDDLFLKEGHTNRAFTSAANRAALFIMLYRGYPMLQLPFQLLNNLLEIDEQLSAWRHRHMNMVHRMIGTRIGTGGSTGKDYLKAAADKHYIFKEIAQLTSFLIERRKLPKLPPEIERMLGFHS